MIRLLHPANISGKTFPAGTCIGTLDARTEQLFVDAGNAKYVTPKSAEGKKSTPRAKTKMQPRKAESKSQGESEPNEVIDTLYVRDSDGITHKVIILKDGDQWVGEKTLCGIDIPEGSETTPDVPTIGACSECFSETTAADPATTPSAEQTAKQPTEPAKFGRPGKPSKSD